MSEHERRYISYLLRLWQTEDDKGLVWRASLECPHSGERRGFSSLVDLYAYLEREMMENEQQQAPPGEGPER